MTTNNTPVGVDFGNMTDEQLRAALVASQKENTRLKLKKVSKGDSGTLTMKVSEKGAISAYGLGSFPVSLYEPAWRKLLAHAEEIIAFIDAARQEGALPTDEEVAAGKAAAKAARLARAAAKQEQQA